MVETEKLDQVTENARQDMKQEPSPSRTVLMFREFATKLDDKYDRLERLIKISRDVTIESKRIIFQLHRVAYDPSALGKAGESLNFVRDKLLHKMAVELDGFDKYYYVRAFTPGLQEFIEAYGFYKFLKTGVLPTYEDLQNYVLTFKVYCDTGYLCSSNKFCRPTGKNRTNKAGGGRNSSRFNKPRCTPEQNLEPPKPDADDEKTQEPPAPVPAVNTDSNSGDKTDVAQLGATTSSGITKDDKTPQTADALKAPDDCDSGLTKFVMLYLPQSEFLLGLFDIPGELMRACINAVANGDKEFAFRSCDLIQHFYAGCLAANMSRLRGVHNKLSEMRASVQKMEYSCYSLRIRDRDDKVTPPLFRYNFEDSFHDEDYDSGND